LRAVEKDARPAVTVTAQVIDADSLAATASGGHPLTVTPTVGPGTGFAALEQTLLECAPGRSGPRATGAAEEVLFVLEGRGTLRLGGAEHSLEPESGVCLAPSEEYELENAGPELLRIVAVRIPDPQRNDAATAGADAANAGAHTANAGAHAATAGAHAANAGGRATVRRLADQTAEAATTEREFRIVADPATGLRSATHFVGYIPLTRAPDHFHTYDEVIYVLDGQGVFRAGGIERPLATGSCIQLPARTVHCLENTGPGLMRVVAVFRPAGSPAAAYYPDGSPAYPGAPPLEAT
jgi:quercetin dioxygenase-like cupin family protein